MSNCCFAENFPISRKDRGELRGRRRKSSAPVSLLGWDIPAGVRGVSDGRARRRMLWFGTLLCTTVSKLSATPLCACAASAAPLWLLLGICSSEALHAAISSSARLRQARPIFCKYLAPRSQGKTKSLFPSCLHKSRLYQKKKKANQFLHENTLQSMSIAWQ